MEITIILLLTLFLVILPLLAGLMAKQFSLDFWFWFWMSMPFPVIVHCILICIPEKPEENAAANHKKISM